MCKFSMNWTEMRGRMMKALSVTERKLHSETAGYM